ncbi:hypothetical protein [Ruminococcus sp. Marseille-P6503]|uniref:hypothetical protein n=1 Tax=Ruminococcus sp. Marseille-P6503 TaxID=2364796 RepID=UPI000F5264BF|nr:hypothetical protein [Ruminococcus sp. Marseille-P6503]
MTDKELHKLNRTELLELLVAVKKELDRANGEIELLKAQIADKADAEKEYSGTLLRMSKQLDGLCSAMNIQLAVEEEIGSDE